MLKSIVDSAFSSEVILAVLVCQLAFVLLVAVLMLVVKVYRKIHRDRILRLLKLPDVRVIRKRLEKRLVNPSADGLRRLRLDIDALTRRIYDAKSPASEIIGARRHAAELHIEKRRFPEILLASGERAELMCQKDFSGKFILDLMLKRELGVVYALDVAVRALQAVGIEQPGPRETITVCRVRAATSRNLSRKVLRFIASSAETPLRTIAKAELGEIQEVAHGIS